MTSWNRTRSYVSCRPLSTGSGGVAVLTPTQVERIQRVLTARSHGCASLARFHIHRRESALLCGPLRGVCGWVRSGERLACRLNVGPKPLLTGFLRALADPEDTLARDRVVFMVLIKDLGTD